MQSSKVGGGEIINIGSGKNYSIWDVAKLVLRTQSKTRPEELLESGKCVMVAPRHGEVRKTLADIAKAKELLGWEPTANLEEGLSLLS